jgi:two-component system chemotaxis response regulator CheB
MPAAYGKDGEPLESGRIYVAPPDRHLLVEGGRICLGIGPRENGSRPAVDPLFRSIARDYGAGAIGVVLSGSLYDGTAGLAAIKARGGITVVQDPEDAVHSGMPRSAIDNVTIDHIVESAQLPALLQRLVEQSSPPAIELESADAARALAHEVDIARDGVPDETPSAQYEGVPSGFACPDCHGVLWEIKDGDLLRLRCRVGHAYLPEALAEAQSEEIHAALWTALRALRESAALATRLAERARERNMMLAAQSHEGRALEARERARVIEAVLNPRTTASERDANTGE